METVVLMAKAPVAGRVKTRLSTPLSSEEASSLYEGMLWDTAACLASPPGIRCRVFFSPRESAPYFGREPFDVFRADPQQGADLGERMSHAIGAAFAEGARRVAVVGADCPALSPRRIRQAFRELRDGAEAVFGPTSDGGFYLAGFVSDPGEIFGKGVAWSTGSVLATVTERCRKRGMAWSLLAEERDIDTMDDLAWLRDQVAGGRSPRCPETRRRISGIFSGFGRPEDFRIAGSAGRTSGR